jgi:F-type H+-transporting ATPase subunit b
MASETHGTDSHGAEHAADHAAKSVGEAFPPFDVTTFTSQLFWLAIAFILLYFLLSQIILPKLGGVIEERKNRVVSDLDEAAKMKADADEALVEMDKQLAVARADARAKAEETRSQIDAKIAEINAAKSVELDAKLAEAEAEIEKMKTEMMSHVAEIANDTASAMLSRFDVSASQAEIAKRVSKSIEEVTA